MRAVDGDRGIRNKIKYGIVNGNSQPFGINPQTGLIYTKVGKITYIKFKVPQADIYFYFQILIFIIILNSQFHDGTGSCFMVRLQKDRRIEGKKDIIKNRTTQG